MNTNEMTKIGRFFQCLIVNFTVKKYVAFSLNRRHPYPVTATTVPTKEFLATRRAISLNKTFVLFC